MQVNPAVLDRIRKALNFEEPDRVPIWESLENQHVYEHFAPGVPFPECAAIACRELGIDATYGCMQPVCEERREGSTVYAGQTAWRTEPYFRSIDELRAYRPAPMKESELEEQMLSFHAQTQALYGPDVIYLPQDGGFGFLPGYDAHTFAVIAAAMREDLPALVRFWDLQTERAVQRNTLTARHRLAPVIQCCEDVAYKTGLMVSPVLLREHFFPRFKQVIAPLKRAGIKVIWHSDGNISGMLDDAVACGIDGINPIDPSAGMDLGEIRRRHGKGLILVGNVGRGHVLQFGTPEQVRQDVRRCIREASRGGGHMIQCGDGELMPDIPLENAIAYFDEARRFGRYPVPD